MEVAGVEHIFKRSLTKYNLRYTEYYGDGDSKSYVNVKDTYERLRIKKLECVGHVQKRVGTRLLSLKKRKVIDKKKDKEKVANEGEKRKTKKLTNVKNLS